MILLTLRYLRYLPRYTRAPSFIIYLTNTPSIYLSHLTTLTPVLQATEAGLRSTGGSLAIKIPKFFLSFQMARIKTAQGVEITAAGQTVEHLLGKVLSNTKGESQAARDQVTALAGVLA